MNIEQEDPSGHCDFCLAVVPFYMKGGVEHYSNHYPENKPYQAGVNVRFCQGSDKRLVLPGQALAPSPSRFSSRRIRRWLGL